MNNVVMVSDAEPEHIDGAKQLADANRPIFGFLTRGAFHAALQERCLIIALRNNNVVGFLRYHHRKRDRQTTLYDICVAKEARGEGIGQQMLSLLIERCHALNRETVVLKCPVQLDANKFYARNGFICAETLIGKHQRINVWRKTAGN